MLSQVCLVVAFMAGVAVATSGAILLAGHFPAARLPNSHRLASWRALVWLNLVLLVAVVIVALASVVGQLHWPVAVIAGGLALLFGPLLYHMVPRRLIDQRAGLVVQAVIAAVMLVWLLWIMPSADL